MAIVLTIINQTQNPRMYLNQTVTVPVGGNYSAVMSNIFQLSRDSILAYDCKQGNVILTDGVNQYQGNDALDYLSLIAGSLGGSVVGFAGAAAPDFQITTGGKDPNGNSQPVRLNQFTDQAINFRNSYKNITGNQAVTVKAASGTLHGIMINNTGTGGTAAIYDSASGSGTLIATLSLPSGGLTSGGQPPEFIGPLGLEFETGLTIVTSGSTSNDITAVYQ